VVAALALCAGASPLIYYNFESHGATLRPGAVAVSSATFAQKFLVLRETIDGSVLFGWVTEEANPEFDLAPRGTLQKASVTLSNGMGSSISNWMVYALAVTVCLLPWLWFTPARRPALFALVYLVVAWALMILLPNTGASLHHVLLLWPFPHFLIAVAGAQISYSFGKRGTVLVAGAFVLLAASNLLVVNHLYADFVTRGTTVIWTDAVVPLSRYLKSLPPAKVIAIDWGYSATLCLLSDGTMPANDISATLIERTAQDDNWVAVLMRQPNTIFVGYDGEREIMPGVRQHLASIAAKAGFRETVIARIRDRNNRARFDVFRYASPGRQP